MPQLAYCEVSLGQAEIVPEPTRPMLPFLVDLEREFDAGVERDYDPTELVRYAIGASDYWAYLALGWLDQGVPPQPLVTELEQLEADKSRPQNRVTKRAACESRPDKRTDMPRSVLSQLIWRTSVAHQLT
jgi:hypothetical protein